MTASSLKKTKPLFFVHTIDPIIWPLLMIFVRPFYQIICFQYQRVRKSGFERLEISNLSAEEFSEGNREGLEFARRVNLSRRLKIEASISGRALDVANYFAKDFLRYATDLALSVKMIAKLNGAQGIFILPRYCPSASLQKEFVEITAASGLRYSEGWEIFIRWIYNPLCALFKICMYWAAFVLIVFKKKQAPEVTLADKIIAISYIPSELQEDFLRQLSAGFFIDGRRIKKEEVLFLARPSKEADAWREAGFCAQAIIDYTGPGLLLRALWESLVLFYEHPIFVFRFLLLFSPRLLVYLILCELLMNKNSLRGVIYTNSDVTIEPIISISFRARNLPVVLYYYSASTFVHPMWAYLQADHVFVWNEGMINFLNAHPQNGEKKFFISGPLMQIEDHLRSETLAKLQGEFAIPADQTKLKVGIFDIAPIKENFLEDSRFVQNPKLTSVVHQDFLFDIFSLAEKRSDIVMMLKPKRWTPKHDLAPEIKKLVETGRENIVFLPPTLNPQAAIQSCQLVICFPFTSIFFAALQKNIPAIFYYPFEDPGLKKILDLQPFTIYGRENLQAWFKDFQAGKVLPPSREEIIRLCGIAPGENVRNQFINSLTEIYSVTQSASA